MKRFSPLWTQVGAASCEAAGAVAADLKEPRVQEPRVQILTEEGAALLDADATAISVGAVGQFEFTEGPVWVARRGAWLFSDIPGDTMYTFAAGELSVFRKPSANANGNFLDNEGRLLTCEHRNRVLSRTVLDGVGPLGSGERTVLASAFGGKPLNSPNDTIVSRLTGAIYFTDPGYGALKSIGHGVPVEQECNSVYRLDPASGELTAVECTFSEPNGLCLSPDETLMYIADSGACSAAVDDAAYTASHPHHVRVFDVVDGGRALANGRVFCTVADGNGVPDGVRCDATGNLWVSVASGVDVYSASTGALIAQVLTPQTVANAAFGGPGGSDLMMCSCTSTWILPTKTKGSGDINPHGIFSE
jgi:gluconolactonase